MSRPIAPTPKLNKKETRRFLNLVEEGLKHPVGPVPTPKTDETIKLIMENAEKQQKQKGEIQIEKIDKEYSLTITPALEPRKRHKIEEALESLGYKVLGGGTCTDMSECDIHFSEIEK